MIKRLLFVSMLLLVAVVSVAAAQTDEPLPRPTEILWDSWGVPHIFAPDNESLFYAFGWAMATNHADLILQLYAESRGQAAAYFGADHLENDRLVRTLGIPQEAEAGYASAPPEWQTYADAFAAGINAYAEANPDDINPDALQVLPVTGVDIVAQGARTLRWNFVAGRGIRYALGQQPEPEPTGSNAWVVGPARSASGNAMLVANPHQPWSSFGLWMEAHFITPDVNLYGAALMGTPVLGIAFNERLGWTHTVNTHDGWDLYDLTLTADGGAYLFDGEARPFDIREEVIRIRQEDGSFTEEILTVRESVHGPVLAEQEPGRALALRVVGENSFEAAQQWWEMGHATNLAEFEAALRDIRIPMFTIMYTDRDGNILHVFNEQVPVRSTGDWDFWNGTTLLGGEISLIPGDTSEYLWERVYHPYEDLPRVLNPESGWLQNANEPPFTTTLPRPFEPEDFPPYMLPDPYIWPRPITSMRLLHEDESITYAELLEDKHSTFVELARLLLDDLIAAAATSDDELAQQAAAVLADWDRRADADSRGAVLFAAWANTHVSGFEAFASPWSLDNPIDSLSGLADPDAAVADLIDTAQQLEQLRALGVGMDVAYGDVFRLRFLDSGVDLPANGTEDLLGSFRILNFTQDDDLRFRPTQGDSYIAVVEFGETVQAQVLLAYGNATQSGNPHVGDQLELFAGQQLRPALLTREAIEADLNRAETLD